MQTRIVTEDMTYTIDLSPEEFMKEFLDDHFLFTKDFVRIKPLRRENNIYLNTRVILRVEEV